MSSSSHEIEEGSKLLPSFDKSDVLPCITVDAETGEILMLAYMNREALDMTIRTQKATYYSRSRKKIWIKGEESGHTQHVQELLVDCDQDCFILKVKINGGAACHVGYKSCFYRKLKNGTTDQLELTMKKNFDPEKVYGKKKN